MLSLKCPNCGGVVFFTEENIATHCSFCGTPLPDMKDYVVKAAEMQLKEKEHKMEVETINLDTNREKVRNQSNIHDTIRIVSGTIGVLTILGFTAWVLTAVR